MWSRHFSMCHWRKCDPKRSFLFNPEKASTRIPSRKSWPANKSITRRRGLPHFIYCTISWTLEICTKQQPRRTDEWSTLKSRRKRKAAKSADLVLSNILTPLCWWNKAQSMEQTERVLTQPAYRCSITFKRSSFSLVTTVCGQQWEHAVDERKQICQSAFTGRSGMNILLSHTAHSSRQPLLSSWFRAFTFSNTTAWHILMNFNDEWSSNDFILLAQRTTTKYRSAVPLFTNTLAKKEHEQTHDQQQLSQIT